MQNIDVVSTFDIRPDTNFDNTSRLLNMRDGLTRGKQSHYNLVFPERDVETRSVDNRWLFGVLSYKIINGILRSTYQGSDEAMHRPLFVGEVLQNNVLTYDGKKEYEIASMILGAVAGCKLIVLVDESEASKFWEGARIKIYAYDQIGRGDPPGMRYFEWNQIKTINDRFIMLEAPLENTYDDRLWDNPSLSGGGAGMPRILNLDRPQNIYCKLAEFENVRFCNSLAGQPGSVAIPADTLSMNRCIVEGFLWTSENHKARYYDTKLQRSELDKFFGNAEFIGCEFSGSPNGGGGGNSIVLRDCIAYESTRFDSRYVELVNCHLHANSDPDEAIAALASYPAHSPVRRLTIDRLTLTTGPAFVGDSLINPAPFDSMIIQVTDEHIIIPFIDHVHPTGKPVKMIEAGFTAIWKSDGTNGGMVTNIYFDEHYGAKGAFIIEGDWDECPRSGERWVWSHVREIIDKGGHRNLSDVRLWGKESIRWKGNQSTSLVKDMILTHKDFMWPGNLTIDLNGYIISITPTISKLYKFAAAKIGLDIVNSGNLLECDMKTGKIVSKVDPAKWVEQFTMNSYSIVGALTEETLPEFELAVKWRPFTH